MSDLRAPDPREAGRSDPPEILANRLSRAEPEYLEGAADNPALDADLLLLLLRNRSAGPRLIARLARDPRFRRSYEVRAALVRHARTPRAVALGLVPHLFWRDLARAADDVRVPPPVRRAAVRALEPRLEEMAVGEQITLARTAGRAVLLALRRTRDERVAQALLANSRAVEEDAVFVAASAETPPAILTLLGRDRRWVCRYAVRLALVNNRNTPVGVALGLLTGLQRRDLEGVAVRPDRAAALRLAARRVLRRRRGRPGSDDEAGDDTAPRSG
jgi:hypothetical protein